MCVMFCVLIILIYEWQQMIQFRFLVIRRCEFIRILVCSLERNVVWIDVFSWIFYSVQLLFFGCSWSRTLTSCCWSSSSSTSWSKLDSVCDNFCAIFLLTSCFVIPASCLHSAFY